MMQRITYLLYFHYSCLDELQLTWENRHWLFDSRSRLFWSISEFRKCWWIMQKLYFELLNRWFFIATPQQLNVSWFKLDLIWHFSRNASVYQVSQLWHTFYCRKKTTKLQKARQDKLVVHEIESFINQRVTSELKTWYWNDACKKSLDL